MGPSWGAGGGRGVTRGAGRALRRFWARAPCPFLLPGSMWWAEQAVSTTTGECAVGQELVCDGCPGTARLCWTWAQALCQPQPLPLTHVPRGDPAPCSHRLCAPVLGGQQRGVEGRVHQLLRALLQAGEPQVWHLVQGEAGGQEQRRRRPHQRDHRGQDPRQR